MIRRIVWRAVTTLIVLSMAVPFVQATPPPAAVVGDTEVLAQKSRAAGIGGKRTRVKWKIGLRGRLSCRCD